MSGSTTELALSTAVDSDDLADYLTINDRQNMITLDALFSAVTGHSHNGAHQGGAITSIPISAIPDGSITSAKIADNGIAAIDLAPGAAATNIGALGGELGGTLPNAVLRALTNEVGGIGTTLISSASTWTVWAQATSIVLGVGTYLCHAAATFQTTSAAGGKCSIYLGVGSNVAGVLLSTDLNYINVDNQTWRIRFVDLFSVATPGYSPWLQIFTTHVGTVSDGKCGIVKVRDS